MKLTIDFTQRDGFVRPLHGLDNGPVCYGSLVDVTAHYKELGVPYIRLHDTNWPHPREVDVYAVFPDFDADENDPASYDFAATDDYLRACLDTGAKLIYRLGVSIEHTKRKLHTAPPPDFEKWARVCAGIIRHCNEGWADGHHFGIEYWEVWNEPESAPGSTPETNAMWGGTNEQYFALYEAAARAIKREHPGVKVGGPAYTYCQPDFLRAFLGYVRERGCPFDFFSWHTYADHPEVMAAHAREMRALLDEFGFSGVETQCNEYNYWRRPPEGLECWADMSESLRGCRGAAFVAGTLVALQDAPVDIVTYYDGAPTSFWSCFDRYGRPGRAYHALRAFSRLAALRGRVPVAVTEPERGVYALAAADGARGALLIAAFRPEDRAVTLAFTGDGTLTLTAVDEARDFIRVWDKPVAAGADLPFVLDDYGVYLLEFEAR